MHRIQPLLQLQFLQLHKIHLYSKVKVDNCLQNELKCKCWMNFETHNRLKAEFMKGGLYKLNNLKHVCQACDIVTMCKSEVSLSVVIVILCFNAFQGHFQHT